MGLQDKRLTNAAVDGCGCRYETRWRHEYKGWGTTLDGAVAAAGGRPSVHRPVIDPEHVIAVSLYRD